MKKEIKTAYIIPKVEVSDGKLVNLIVTAPDGLKYNFKRSSLGFAYKIENNTPTALFDYSFYNKISKEFGGLGDISDKDVESFCERMGYTPTKIINTQKA